MKIGFDAKRLFHNYTGLGNYSRSLVQQLAMQYPEHEYHLFSPKISQHSLASPFLKANDFELHTSDQLFWRSLGISSELVRSGIDLYHGLSHEIPFKFPTTVKSIVTIHDLIFYHYPEHYPWFDRQVYDKKFRYSCQRSDAVIAISEQTRKDILARYNINPEKVHVIPQSCDRVFQKSLNEGEKSHLLGRFSLPNEFMLYVGSIVERKNLLTLVKALQILPTEDRIPLVVVGKGKKYEKQVRDYIEKNNLSPFIQFVSDINTHELAALYQQAKLFVYPSIYEGFGIPIIEALWSKVPVLTSPISSLPEAAGPDAKYVAPHDVEAMAAGITAIVGDSNLANEMKEKGYEYVQRFRPETIATSVMNLYQAVFA